MFKSVQKEDGFSLVELLVVIAIIGVLAAAGVIGYNKYLAGAKDSTQANNAASLAQALKTTQIARNGALAQGGADDPCSINNPSSTVSAFGDGTTVLNCANKLVSDGNFKSPYNITGPYLALADSCSSNSGQIVIASGATSSTQGTLLACDANGSQIGSPQQYMAPADKF